MPNPYRPPAADLSDGQPHFRGGFWLWLGAAYLMLGGVSGMASTLFWNRLVELSGDTATVIPDLGVGIRVVSFAASLVSAIAAVFLVRRKSVTWKLLAVLLGLSVVTTGWTAASTDWLQISGMSSLASTAVGWAITGALLFYVRRLEARGVFR